MTQYFIDEPKYHFWYGNYGYFDKALQDGGMKFQTCTLIYKISKGNTSTICSRVSRDTQVQSLLNFVPCNAFVII